MSANEITTMLLISFPLLRVFAQGFFNLRFLFTRDGGLDEGAFVSLEGIEDCRAIGIRAEDKDGRGIRLECIANVLDKVLVHIQVQRPGDDATCSGTRSDA